MPEYLEIKTENAVYVYPGEDESAQGTLAIDGIDLAIRKGEFVAVLGRNGSGKSTLAKLFNALLLPTSGVVIVTGIDTKEEERIWDIRQSVGMIFQNPDNQIVGTIVEEDVAFGPENIGVPPAEIRVRVDAALKTVGMSEYAEHAPHLLSGGQKQRIAIAGILAMKPECMVLDEATAMLDPIGRRDILAVIRKLNKEERITVVHITHHMDEAVAADRVFVMDKGRIVLSGTPAEVFSNVAQIKGIGLDVPQITELFYELTQDGFAFPEGIMEIDAGVAAIKGYLTNVDQG
jgi:energy-coupling factor transport system ATP-binding protein